MVERQPEKLKVVGSNPIPDKMLFTFFYLTLLVLINDTVVFGFSPLTLVLCTYFITLAFKRKNYTYNTNIKFILSNVALQLWLLLSASAQSLYMYTTSVRVLK